ncbi:DUF4190 domain-containing protein [Microbacterium gilvum]|uniref:DUF4190 domain-containing protein n=1 Tax=Microbacterium gilvum TaxID=1336204 RepID=A0ABP9A1F2_9MICO
MSTPNYPPGPDPQQPSGYGSPSSYGTPGEPPAYPAAGYGSPAPAQTNTMAIVSIIVVWFVSLLGIILGHIALSQIKRTGEGGRGIALTAVVAGYILLGLTIIGGILGAIFFFGSLAYLGTIDPSIYETTFPSD